MKRCEKDLCYWKAGQSRSAGDIKIFSTDQSWALIHHYNTSLAQQHENESMNLLIPSSKWSFDSCTNYSWIHQAIHIIPEKHAGKFGHQHTKICSSGRAWTSPAHGSCGGAERSRPVVCRFFVVFCSCNQVKFRHQLQNSRGFQGDDGPSKRLQYYQYWHYIWFHLKLKSDDILWCFLTRFPSAKTNA